MKRFFLLLLSFQRCWIAAFDMAECDAMEPKDYWICTREGGSLQVTYDCSETKNKVTNENGRHIELLKLVSILFF